MKVSHINLMHLCSILIKDKVNQAIPNTNSVNCDYSRTSRGVITFSIRLGEAKPIALIKLTKEDFDNGSASIESLFRRRVNDAAIGVRKYYVDLYKR